MKKKISLILAAVIVVTLLFGCASSDYTEAVAKFESGEYTEAKAMFEALDNYKDSKVYVFECDYQKALRLMADEKFEEAKEAFEALDDYKDSSVQAAECEHQVNVMEAGEVELLISIMDDMMDGEVSLTDELTIKEARNRYNALSDDAKLLVSNYSILDNAEIQFAVIKCKDLFYNFYLDDGLALLNQYADRMDYDTKLDCLLEYGRWYCFSYTEQNIISRLKNPNSYSRLNGNTFLFPMGENSLEYAVDITINYTATNSFGGTVRDTYAGWCNFTPHVITLSISDIRLISK